MTSLASGVSMFDCRSEKPLSIDFIFGSRPRSSPGIAISSVFAGFSKRSKPMTAGLPPSLMTRSANSAVSTPLSHTAMLTGAYLPEAGSAMSRVAQMSGLSTLFAARYDV